eukprot:m.239443 g.239443  ORF g.239443 m.239443 type:complete len:62 (+) comp13937_c0_seq12:2639-2824(+)
MYPSQEWDVINTNRTVDFVGQILSSLAIHRNLLLEGGGENYAHSVCGTLEPTSGASVQWIL